VVPPSRAAIVWLTWWVGDSIGVVLFAPMTLMFLPPTREGWRGRRMKVIVPSIIVLAATTWFSLTDAAVARADQDRESMQLAIEASAQLQRSLDR
jgi:integral membrane sensor domain MASE1